jgi:hypothetical protein
MEPVKGEGDSPYFPGGLDVSALSFFKFPTLANLSSNDQKGVKWFNVYL